MGTYALKIIPVHCFANRIRERDRRSLKRTLRHRLRQQQLRVEFRPLSECPKHLRLRLRYDRRYLRCLHRWNLRKIRTYFSYIS